MPRVFWWPSFVSVTCSLSERSAYSLHCPAARFSPEPGVVALHNARRPPDPPTELTRLIAVSWQFVRVPFPFHFSFSLKCGSAAGRSLMGRESVSRLGLLRARVRQCRLCIREKQSILFDADGRREHPMPKSGIRGEFRSSDPCQRLSHPYGARASPVPYVATWPISFEEPPCNFCFSSQTATSPRQTGQLFEACETPVHTGNSSCLLCLYLGLHWAGRRPPDTLPRPAAVGYGCRRFATARGRRTFPFPALLCRS